MRLDEYLETVSEQIRYTKIRQTVSDELKAHILDQAEAYEECGAFPEEALERAVREMGDPVETGVALDRVHRPQMHWGIAGLIGIISIFSIGLFYAANAAGFDSFSWQRHGIYIMIGFALMLITYRLDYSFLSNFSWQPCIIYLAVLLLGLACFGQIINGMRLWIVIPLLPFAISFPEAMLLYVPLFGAALHSFRGEGYSILWKAALLLFIPVFFVYRCADLSGSLLLFTCLFFVFILAVWKGWYQIHRKLVAGLSSGIVLLTPAAILGYFYFFGETYQTDRIRAFFTQSGDVNYIVSFTKTLRENSALFGQSHQSVEQFLNGPADTLLTDYILVSMCSFYGILLTIIMLSVLMFLIMKVFRISITQKNQLGMITGFGCGMVFLVKTLVSILINLQLIPYVSISMPFFSYGGSSILVSYILLGLVLSVYRYKNILPNKPVTKGRRLKLTLTWETR